MSRRAAERLVTVALLFAAGAMVSASSGAGRAVPPRHRAPVVYASAVMSAPLAEAGPPGSAAGDPGCPPGQDPG
ncbi:MAG: sodium-independent anion transporter, partial [Actinomycetota bacterium]|nr:sodium-independent anion transporter [Actinomycetota bacterium]